MDEPDFENMSKEEVDQMLIAYGYDPEMVARTGRFVAQVGIENVKLKSEIDRLQADVNKYKHLSEKYLELATNTANQRDEAIDRWNFLLTEMDNNALNTTIYTDKLRKKWQRPK